MSGNQVSEWPTSGESPEKTLRRFAECVRERDLENLLSLYEPDAVFVPAPTVALKGHARLRVAFQDLFQIKPKIYLVSTHVYESGDLALAANDWSLSGSAPDGTPVLKSGRSAVVLRRSSSGTWLIAIDRP